MLTRKISDQLGHARDNTIYGTTWGRTPTDREAAEAPERIIEGP